MWGGKAEAMCGQHHWPVWGKERIDTMIRQQRDLYKFAHDQTIRLMNHGLTATEIAETIKLPASLEGAWHTRGYYGHIRHNVKAIYQKYLGWYDANPVHLDPLPPVESGKKYVEYMGGADAILERARKDFAKGEFRFVAQAVSHLVFADPDNAGRPRTARRHLRAARLCRRERDLAQRLSVRRAGIAAGHAEGAAASADAARNAGRAAHQPVVGRARRPAQRPQGRRQAHRAELEFYRHRSENFVLTLENCALTYLAGAQAATADASFTLARGTLDEVIAKQTTFPEAVAAGKIKFTGNAMRLAELMGLMDEFPRMFEIVEPKRTAVS